MENVEEQVVREEIEYKYVPKVITRIIKSDKPKVNHNEILESLNADLENLRKKNIEEINLLREELDQYKRY